MPLGHRAEEVGAPRTAGVESALRRVPATSRAATASVAPPRRIRDIPLRADAGRAEPITTETPSNRPPQQHESGQRPGLRDDVSAAPHRPARPPEGSRSSSSRIPVRL